MDLASRKTPYQSDKVRRLNRYTHHPNGERMCSNCQKVKTLNEEHFGIHRYYYNENREVKNIGYDSVCKLCMVEKRAAHSKRVKEDPKWYCRKLVSQLRFRAKEQCVPFDLTAEDLYEELKIQKFLCKHTGKMLDFTLKSSGNYPHRDFPSVDKMSPKLGYVKGNIAWVIYVVNRMKGDLTEEEFITFCKNIGGKQIG